MCSGLQDEITIYFILDPNYACILGVDVVMPGKF